jgi:hypothetical protein
MKQKELKIKIKERIFDLESNLFGLELYWTLKNTPVDTMKKSMVQQRKSKISSLYWVLDMI